MRLCTFFFKTHQLFQNSSFQKVRDKKIPRNLRIYIKKKKKKKKQFFPLIIEFLDISLIRKTYLDIFSSYCHRKDLVS